MVVDFVMPFKTRAQKLAASQRRFSFDSLGKVSYQKDFKKPPEKAKEEIVDPFRLSAGKIEDLSYLKSDVFRIVIASLLIIAAQLAFGLTLS